MRAFFLLSCWVLLRPRPAPNRFRSSGMPAYLGEWELTATVTENASRRAKELLRAIDDEACWPVHAGRPGGEDR